MNIKKTLLLLIPVLLIILAVIVYLILSSNKDSKNSSSPISQDGNVVIDTPKETKKVIDENSKSIFPIDENVQDQNAKNNDYERLESLDALNKATVLALADGEIVLFNTSTCAECTSNTGSARVDGSGWVRFAIPNGRTGIGKYLSTLLVDPINNAKYNFKFASDGINYEFNALLEHPDNATRMSTDGGDNSKVYEIGTDPGLDLIN